MSYKSIDRVSRRTFSAMKWLLTAVSGVFTTGFIIMLES